MKPLQLPSFTLIGTMVIELREFNDKKKKKKKNNMDKMQKLITKSGSLGYYFIHRLFST